MTWHLKDREFERKLIESCPNFLKELEDGVVLSNREYDWISVEFARENAFGELVDNRLFFWRDELEEVYEYNPHCWNDSRKVKPPEDIFLRVKIHYAMPEDPKKYFTNYGCLIYNQGSWYSIDDDKPYEYPIEIGPVDWIEFRPWED